MPLTLHPDTVSRKVLAAGLWRETGPVFTGGYALPLKVSGIGLAVAVARKDGTVNPASLTHPTSESVYLGLSSNGLPMQTLQYEFDVVVVGAGHAGTEAALAAARMGARVALLTTNLDTVAQMSCNPAIGGIAKGQMVREIDALGGAMGRAIDATGIQFRMLNRRKGPAMHGPRAQADKRAYQQTVKRFVEQQPNLTLRQEIVEDLVVEPCGETCRAVGVRVRGDAVYRTSGVVLTTGTFLQALLHLGESQTPGGRAGEGTTSGLSAALRRCRLACGTLQDGYATPLEPANDRHPPHGRTAGRCRAPAVLLSDAAAGNRAASLLDHLHQRAGPRCHSR